MGLVKLYPKPQKVGKMLSQVTSHETQSLVDEGLPGPVVGTLNHTATLKEA